LDNEQKRQVIADLLKADPSMSDRHIGKAAAADHKTVAAQRDKMVSTGELPQLKERKGADGKVRKVKKAADNLPDHGPVSDDAGEMPDIPPELRRAPKALITDTLTQAIQDAVACTDHLHACKCGDRADQFAATAKCFAALAKLFEALSEDPRIRDGYPDLKALLVDPNYPDRNIVEYVATVANNMIAGANAYQARPVSAHFEERETQ
jgi:hypothetical protein